VTPRGGDRLLVFLKRPSAGEVKTRMVPALGPDRAASLYRLLAEATLSGTHSKGDRLGRRLLYAPREAREEIARWFPGEELVPQEGLDLGERLAHAFRGAFAEGAGRVAVIGTDCPRVSLPLVLQALDALENADLVLGPARDGGYYLLALKVEVAQLFDRIPWGTGGVLSETRARAETLGLRTTELETLGDIDTPEDLVREWDALAPLLERDPSLREACLALVGRKNVGGR
jgi:rSAM/selenodomain-associated transferase 1